MMLAGGGWTDEPGHGGVRIGFNTKVQPDAKRLDTEGEIYQSLYSLTFDFRYLYLSGDVGIIKGLEASWLFTYLWASETVDSTSEDPSRYYDGLSDFWLGAKYQILSGEYPVAIGASIRLPYLYEASSTINGFPTTEVPGLLKRDYEVDLYASHSFTSELYGSAMAGFKFREGSPANQITFNVEAGGTLPFIDHRLFAKLCLDGVASIGGPDPYRSTDRFSGYTTERGTHAFDFNNASYMRPQIVLAYSVPPSVDLSAGYAYTIWGHSAVVYHDILFQVGYTF